MTFSCNHCQTRYHIADEKVRGKILQVRCRSCQNLVEVKDPELAATSRPASAASMTLLGIAALPREASAFAQPASAPATALPAPKPPVPPKPTSPMPSYATRPATPGPTPPAQPNRPPTLQQPAPPIPPKPAAPPPPRPPAPSVAPPVTARPSSTMPSYTARPVASHSVLPTQPVKPPIPHKPVASPSAPMYVPSAAGLQSSPSAPVAPPTEPKQWYFNRKGERSGPFRFSELTALISEGSVKPEDYAWSPEIVHWKQVKDVPLFSVYLPKEPPPFEAAPKSNPVLPVAAAVPFVPPVAAPAAVPLVSPPSAAPAAPVLAAQAAPVASPSASLPVAAPVVPRVLPPTPVAAPAVPVSPAVAPPVVPVSSKPPTLVKSAIAPQSPMLPTNSPAASPSAMVMQASMNQSAAGPTPTHNDIFAAANDPFGAIPDAADFSAPPQREMSALIPISAMKPPLQRRLLVPALVSVAFIAVAALAFTFGQGTTTKSLGAQTDNNPDEDPNENRVNPVISDKDIASLAGLNGETPLAPVPDPLNPKNPRVNKVKPATSGETPAHEPENTGTAEVKDPVADAKTAAEIEKNKDLFLGKKTAVGPALAPGVGPTATPGETPASGSEKIAMEIISDYSGRSQNCVNRSLTNSEFRKETRLNVSINSDKDGKVTAVSVGNAPANSSIETCLKGVYSGLNFKKAGGALSLKFPIIVTPSF